MGCADVRNVILVLDIRVDSFWCIAAMVLIINWIAYRNSLYNAEIFTSDFIVGMV